MRSVTATRVVSILDILEPDEQIGAISASFDGDPILLTWRGPMPEGIRFPYRIHWRDGATWNETQLEDLRPLGPQFIGRLSPERWIVLVGHQTKLTETAIVLDDDGRIVRSFDPGQDPQVVATGESGEVWIGYGEDPFGPLDGYGLVALDENGNLRFGLNSHVDAHSLPEVFDCYALTATRPNEVWVCYYTDFPLVRIEDHKISEIHGDQPASGGKAFAVGDRRALFARAWGDRESTLGGPWERTPHVFRLVDLQTHDFEDLDIADENGHSIPAGELNVREFAKANRLFLLREHDLLVLDVDAL